MTTIEDRSRELIDAARATYRSTPADRARVRAALAARWQVPPARPGTRGKEAARKRASAASIAGRAILGAALLLGAGGTQVRDASHLPVPDALSSTMPGIDRPAQEPSAGPLEEAGGPTSASGALLDPEGPVRGLEGPPSPARVPTKRIARGAAPVAESTPAPNQDLDEELAMLREARVAFRQNDGRRSLAILAELEIRHPNGLLRTERLAAEVLASCATGETARAGAVARQFLREAPASPLAARVRESCAFDPHPREPEAPTDSRPGGHSSATH